MAAFGAVVARGQEHQDVFGLVGRPDWRDHLPQVLRDTDLSGSRTFIPTRCPRFLRCGTRATDSHWWPTNQPDGPPNCAPWAWKLM